MEPVKFNEANKNLLKPHGMTDAECASLWVFTDGQQCVSRWRLTWRDRLRVLWYSHVWLSVHSGQTQPPVRLDSDRTIFQPLNDAPKISSRQKLFSWACKILAGDPHEENATNLVSESQRIKGLRLWLYRCMSRLRGAEGERLVKKHGTHVFQS